MPQYTYIRDEDKKWKKCPGSCILGMYPKYLKHT